MMDRLSVSVRERVIAPDTKVAITSVSPVLRKNLMSNVEAGWGDKAMSAFLHKERKATDWPFAKHQFCKRPAEEVKLLTAPDGAGS
jgi:hypothetical protein